MKIVNVIGGLGNQMFCYAFALSLKLKHKEDVYVDISHFNNSITCRNVICCKDNKKEFKILSCTVAFKIMNKII